MTEIIEILCREHRNMEKVLRVLERELGVFQRGDRPDYDVLLGIIDYPSRFMPTCCGTAPATSSPVMGTIHARFRTVWVIRTSGIRSATPRFPPSRSGISGATEPAA